MGSYPPASVEEDNELYPEGPNIRMSKQGPNYSSQKRLHLKLSPKKLTSETPRQKTVKSTKPPLLIASASDKNMDIKRGFKKAETTPSSIM